MTVSHEGAPARRLAGFRWIVAALLVTMPSTVSAAACPALVAEATRLMVSVAPEMASQAGAARLFERDEGGASWRPRGGKFPVVFGVNGLGWGFDQVGLLDKGEKAPLTKAEGDGRTPAGLFSAGSPFGFGEDPLKGYITLTPGTICVDDLDSELYNRVVKLSKVPAGLSHEKMWEIPLYRKGLVIENATSRTARGGSCIFLHVWREPGQGTSGCIAASEGNVARAQTLLNAESAAIAILPRSSLSILSDCGIPELESLGK